VSSHDRSARGDPCGRPSGGTRAAGSAGRSAGAIIGARRYRYGLDRNGGGLECPRPRGRVRRRRSTQDTVASARTTRDKHGKALHGKAVGGDRRLGRHPLWSTPRGDETTGQQHRLGLCGFLRLRPAGPACAAPAPCRRRGPCGSCRGDCRSPDRCRAGIRQLGSGPARLPLAVSARRRWFRSRSVLRLGRSGPSRQESARGSKPGRRTAALSKGPSADADAEQSTPLPTRRPPACPASPSHARAAGLARSPGRPAPLRVREVPARAPGGLHG